MAMAKRTVGSAVADGGHPPKRQKTAAESETTAPTAEIHTARQLQQSLRFQQDNLQEHRQALYSFKQFLDPLTKPAGDDAGPLTTRRQILCDYLDAQRAQDDDAEPDNYLADLMQAWSFASNVNNDSLVSAIPAVIALLLRIIGSDLNLRDHGQHLCRTLLRPLTLKLLARGLSANRSKEHLISPCLRLLTEVASFDGGVFAKRVYAQRDSTLKGLARNLGMHKPAGLEQPDDERRKPSVRINALRYLLAVLKFADNPNRADLIVQKDVMSALFRDIRDDPHDLISTTLSTFRDHVVRNDLISAHLKARFLNEWILGRISSLYGYNHSLESTGLTTKSVDIQAHEFLVEVCTKSGAGPLRPSTGWYPQGSQANGQDGNSRYQSSSTSDNPADFHFVDTRYRDPIPILNSCLSAFIQTLRPYSNLLQSDLILAIFRVAPELIADYFLRKKSFGFDPKLTPTWIGYSAFIFSTVRLPVPEYCGNMGEFRNTPPTTLIAIESILPEPLNQKVLTRCLHQKSNLVTFFAVRLLVVAFQKLQNVLRVYRQAYNQGLSLWDSACNRLKDEFCRRCPKMKDVVQLFRSSSEAKPLQKEAITRLLANYYRVIPQTALDERFDVSIALTAAFEEASDTSVSTEDHGLHMLSLQHLLYIAGCSPNMRWWQKPENVPLSPLTTLLRLLGNLPDAQLDSALISLVQSVVRETQLLKDSPQNSSLAALVYSLKQVAKPGSGLPVYEFLDNCMGRYVRKPLQYQDELQRLSEAAGVNGKQGLEMVPISPLLVTIVEQWPFVAKSLTMKHEEKQLIALWISIFLGFARHVDENKVILRELRAMLCNTTGSDDIRSVFESSFKHKNSLKTMKFTAISKSTTSSEVLDDAWVDSNGLDEKKVPTDDELFDLDAPMIEYSGADLFRHKLKDLQEALEDGEASALIMCLCSADTSTRRQALTGLAGLSAKLEKSKYPERQMTRLLLEEAINTAQDLVTTQDQPLPTYLGAFGAQALLVETNPQHPLYSKISRFLLKAPKWNLTKLPLLHNTLLAPPDEDNAHHAELAWMLDVLIVGLRTRDDMDTYRRRNVFESLLSLYATPRRYLPVKLRAQVLRLVYRATGIEGGSTTLLTRSGLWSWLSAQLDLTAREEDGGKHVGRERAALEMLKRRLWETCDQGKLRDWSGGALGTDEAEKGMKVVSSQYC